MNKKVWFSLYGIIICMIILIGCGNVQEENSAVTNAECVVKQEDRTLQEPIVTNMLIVMPELTVTPEPTEKQELGETPGPTEIPTPEMTAKPMITVTPEPTEIPTPEMTAEPRITATPKVKVTEGIKERDYIEFGSYPREVMTEADVTEEIRNAEYDSNGMTTVNGKRYARVNNEEIEEKGGSRNPGKENITYYEFQPLEWLVLTVKDGKAFLLSRYVIDGQPYDSACPGEVWLEDPATYNKYKATWEACSLRKWLNNEFFRSAFDAEQQASIVFTEVKNEPNSLRGRSSGKDTQDWIYLLSESEVLKYLDKELITGYTPKTMPEDTRHCGIPTSFALNRGAYQKKGKMWYSSFCEWSLRSAGGVGIASALIRQPGFLDLDGWGADFYMGIRPCMWIDLETAKINRCK